MTVVLDLALGKLDRWCVWIGVARLCGIALASVAINAKLLPIRIGHELTNAAPELGAAPRRTIAELNDIGKASSGFDGDLAELAALRISRFAQGG